MEKVNIVNSKVLGEKYLKNKDKFYKYIDNIKSLMVVDIYSIINSTIICNPYNTDFPKKFILKEFDFSNKIFIFIRSTFKFYLKNFYFYFSYLISWFLFKIYFKKENKYNEKYIAIDIFFLVDNIIKDNKFNENYFIGLYDVLEKYKQNYIFIPRLYGVGKNPFKLIKLFKILKKDKRNFLFEFELLTLKDFLEIFFLILNYPFKTLRLLQEKKSFEDELFNNELIKDIKNQQFDAFSRYVFGKNIAKLNKIKKIYSWSEFQVIERSFNYAIRNNNTTIQIIACQFFLNYETYFNTVVYDIDAVHKSAPHKVLVNGKYHLKSREKVVYDLGVSLRYKNIFEFNSEEDGKNIILLGSYIEKDTKYMLESIDSFKQIIFKSHPAVKISNFGTLPKNIIVSDANIYELFKSCNIVIGTASGSLLEAVSCGKSVIVIASQNNFTVNPLVDLGKGKIWDIAFHPSELQKIYKKLLSYRMNHKDEIQTIALWYKENFFIQPTEKNIAKAFDLKGAS